MNNINVQLYTDTVDALGNEINLFGETKYTSLMVTNGQVYYIKVKAGGFHYGSSTAGTYRIAINTSTTPPID